MGKLGERTAIYYRSSRTRRRSDNLQPGGSTGILEFTITGGNESLYDSFIAQGTPLTTGVGTYTATDGESIFNEVSNTSSTTTLPSLASPNTLAIQANGVFNSLTSDRNNATTGGFSYKDVTLTFTTDSELPAGSSFNLSFEGVNHVAQIGLTPEPSTSLLGLLGLGALGFLRKRKNNK